MSVATIKVERDKSNLPELTRLVFDWAEEMGNPRPEEMGKFLARANKIKNHLDHLMQHGVLVTASIDDEIVGLMMGEIKFNLLTEKKVFIDHGIYLNRTFRGNGLGRQLFQYTMDLVDSRVETRSFSIDNYTNSNPEKSKDFLLARGYHIVGYSMA